MLHLIYMSKGGRMELLNKKVKHKVFGEGKIVRFKGKHLSIKFKVGEKKFVYPDCFENFLTIENEEMDQVIQEEITSKNTLEEAKEKLVIEKITREIKAVKKQSNKKIIQRENIAIKCTYCDGGQSENSFGFNGVCSKEMLEYNVSTKKKTWCTSDQCLCKLYSKGEKTLEDLEKAVEANKLCYESNMLKDWVAMSGRYQSGKSKGKPMKLQKVQNNSLCVLTTRKPKTTEKDRFIFAVFVVDEKNEGNLHEEGYVKVNTEFKIELRPDEAVNFKFWNYHANGSRSEVPAWSSGLHRYFDDIQSVQILRDIVAIKEGKEDYEIAKKLLEHYCQINDVNIDLVPEAHGALIRAKEI